MYNSPVVRNSSIEMLRIISIIFITMMHVIALLNFGTAYLFNKLLLLLVNAIGNTGVTCFVLISGYYGVRFSRRKFLYLFLTTYFFGCGYSIYMSFSDYQVRQFLSALNILNNYSLWFVICYMILMVFSRYINIFSELLGKTDYRKMIVCCFVIFCIFPILTFSTDNGFVMNQGGKNLVYFLFIYLVGRYIRLHQDIYMNRNRLFTILLISSSFIFTLNLLGSILLKQRFLLFASDCSPLIFISSVCIFYLFKSYSFESKHINSLAKSSLTVYLAQPFLIKIIDGIFINLAYWSTESEFAFLFILEVIIVYSIAVLLDKTIGKVLNYVVSLTPIHDEGKISGT